MKCKYRIENWRHDVDLATVETISFDGKTQAECDQKAIARMNELSQQECFSWDGLRVWRIDVVEKVTFLADNGRQKD